MFKSIFWKQFIIYIGIILISLITLSAAASQAFTGYFISQKKKLLTEQCEKISAIMSDTLKLGDNFLGNLTFQNRMYERVQYLYEYLDTSIIFIDSEFKIIMTTSDITIGNGVTLNQQELLPIMEGEIVSIQGRLNNIFPTQVLTVAYPIVFRNKVVGAVLLNSSIPELKRTISDIRSITLACVVGCAVISFILTYLLSKKLSRPFLEMNEAAKIIANGNFEKRIIVQTNDEVGQLAESFNNMAESLDKQDKIRQEFLANISHDLRSPLTSIRGFLQAIIDRTIPVENQDKYLSIILGETERLSNLADDILTLNKMQSLDAELDRTNFDINELIRKTVLMFEPRVRTSNKSVSLIFADEINIVNADYEKIQRVIQNLLDNAIKFTPPNGEITIETSIIDDKLKIKVQDNGYGMNGEVTKSIFDRFFKADVSRGECKTGSGLGLAIVRAFIKAHEEIITVESEEGFGSKFIFSLPLQAKYPKD